MATIKEKAEEYEPPKTGNIAELDCIPVDIQITYETHSNAEGKEFSMNTIEVKGKKYRVPISVIIGLKAILKKMPGTEYFSVLKDGEGMGTTYQVIPMQKPNAEKI
jgi:hypothetical protein